MCANTFDNHCCVFKKEEKKKEKKRKRGGKRRERQGEAERAAEPTGGLSSSRICSRTLELIT